MESDGENSYSGEEKHSLLSPGKKNRWSERNSASRLLLLSFGLVRIITVAMLTAALVYAFIHTSVRSESTVMRSPCGSSAREAREAGCNFDIISFAWLPDHCYDSELSNTFDQEKQWRWWLDANQTHEISKEEALTGNFEVLYVNWDYHITHCTYMWKKMHRAIMGTGINAIDMYIGPYEHTKHCSHMLLSNRDVALETVNTGIRVKYPDCGLDIGAAKYLKDDRY